MFSKAVAYIRNMVGIRLLLSDQMSKKTSNQVKLYSMKTSMPFTWRRQRFTLISQSILVWAFLTWVYPWCMTFIKTILRLNMVITQKYSSPTLTLSHMQLRKNISTKILTPTLRNGLTTSALFIHLELKQDLIIKCVESQRMKMMDEFVDLRAKPYSHKMLDGSEDKTCKEWQRMLQKEVFNSVTTESACLTRRNNIKKWM